MKKLLILFIFIINCAFLEAPHDSNYYMIQSEQVVTPKKDIYLKVYEEVLVKLKEFEGLRLEAYVDAGGLSIGYGHHIKENEDIPMVITEEYAETLLKLDFEKAINTVEEYTILNRKDNPEKVLALANFVFNLGAGSFQKSTLLKCVQNNQPIDEEIVKWNKVRIGDNVTTYSHLTMRRNYELTLYNRA